MLAPTTAFAQVLANFDFTSPSVSASPYYAYSSISSWNTSGTSTNPGAGITLANGNSGWNVGGTPLLSPAGQFAFIQGSGTITVNSSGVITAQSNAVMWQAVSVTSPGTYSYTMLATQREPTGVSNDDNMGNGIQVAVYQGSNSALMIEDLFPTQGTDGN
jgi:hypothetical protein